jgi:serine/threonine protein kinase
MTDNLWKYELSFNNKSKFQLHMKRGSLGQEGDLYPSNNTLSQNPKREVLPSIKLNPSQREAYSIKHSTNRPTPQLKNEQKSLTFPITPSIALKHCCNILTTYEQSEVLEYSLIYYLGQSEKRLPVNFSAKNYGFDDESGNYKLLPGDHLAYRFEIIEILGKGSFGQVVKCLDHKSGQVCAIKIVKNKRRFHKQALFELKILRYINSHDYNDSASAVHLQENFKFREHVCLKFQILYCNLYELCKSNNFTGLPLPLIKIYAVQIASCLAFLKKHSIIHCDLKPENILICSRGSSILKVIDFGSACFTDERIYTYIQSRFYRAPEVILGVPYDCSIDVWSFGLILAEMFLGYPLFPGENEQEQLAFIVQYLGYPPKDVMEKATRANEFFNEKDEILNKVNSEGKIRYPGSRKISEKVRTHDAKFVELLEGNK